MRVLPIKHWETKQWLLNKHYARRMPVISYAFGLYEDGQLMGICTYGIPASPQLCFGVCGEENKDIVLELNRLVVDSETKNSASYLVGNSLKMLPKPTIVVSYADTAMNHIGYIYQATNFLFTGTTKERTDMGAGDGKHSRHGSHSVDRVFRSAKHRYITFVGSKTDKKRLKKQLNYKVLEYPKGKAERYDASGSVEVQGVLF